MSQFRGFSEFYRFYLSEHNNRINRRCHFIGSCLGLACLFLAVVFAEVWLLALGLVLGYGCAWIGHFFFEKNTPATFQHPFYSFAADWVMFKDILTRKLTA